MLNINLICVGRLKEQYLREACAEYEKRLGAYCRVNIIEIPAYALPDNPSKAQIEAGLIAEGRKILDKIPNGALVYSMCVEGKQMSSDELSREIQENAVDGISSIAFIIGGSFGLSDEVKKCSQKNLSMSKMTFPHQLARVMLLEQLYRAFQISSGGKYHK